MNNVVIIPGWTRNRKSYRKLIKEAPPNWKIFVISYKKLQLDKELNGFENKFLEFLKINHLDKINLLGHSLGGALAMYLASKCPQKIQNLYLADSKGVYEHKFSQEVKNFLKEHKKRSILNNADSIARFLVNPILNTKLLKVMRSTNFEEAARRIKVPTTFFWGEEDFGTPVEEGRRLSKLIKGSKFIELKGMGHDWIFSHPNYFWKSVVF